MAVRRHETLGQSPEISLTPSVALTRYERALGLG